MTEADLRGQLKTFIKGAYVLFGEEDYLIDHYVRAFGEKIAENGPFADWNVVTVSGEGHDFDALLNAVSAVPMMAPQKLVVADSFDLSGAKAQDAEPMLALLDTLKSYPETVLVIRAPSGTFDPGYLPKKPSALYKKLAERAEMVEFPRATPGRLKKWLAKHFLSDGIDASDAVLEHMIARCGTSMRRLASETDKLSAYVLAADRTVLEVADVDLVTATAAEEDAFLLSNAILALDLDRALAALLYEKQQRTEPLYVLAAISKIWTQLLQVKSCVESGKTDGDIATALKLHQYKVGLYRRAVGSMSRERIEASVALCAEADRKLKSTRLGYIALERLLAQTLSREAGRMLG